MKRLLLLSSGGVLIGLSISCLTSMVLLATMLKLYSKDVNEVIVTWFYMALFAAIGGLSGAIGIGAFLILRGVL